MTITVILSILIFCSEFLALIIHGDEHYGEYSSKKFEKAASNLLDKNPKMREFLSFITEAIVVIIIVVSFVHL
jgi:hypothetical protein